MGAIGRNDPCPCGSGKKFKKCCGLKTPKAGQSPVPCEASVEELALHDDPLEHAWTFGPVRVIRGFRTDDLFRDASISEECMLLTVGRVRTEMADVGWCPGDAPNIYFDYDDELAERRMMAGRTYDGFEKRLRLAGESLGFGFVEVIAPIDVSGVALKHLLVLYPKAVKFESARGNRMEVLHGMCHEFAHAFGAVWRFNPAFDQRCEPYFDCLADYFSLRANLHQCGLPDTSGLHRHLQYLSREFMKRRQRQAGSNEEVCEFAESFLTERGVLPCPKELLPETD